MSDELTDALDALFAEYGDEKDKKKEEQTDGMDDLFEALASTVEREATLKDKTIVVTGKLMNYTRHEVEQVIADRGGYCPSSVTKNTVALVVGERPGMTKLRRAVELGLPILDENQFMLMVKGMR
jgi:DNA ligase (NAD+)